MKGVDYVTKTNTYRAFLPFNTPIRKLVSALSGTRTHVSLITSRALSRVIEARIRSQVKKSWALGIPTPLNHLINLLRCQRGGIDGVVA